MSKHIVIDNRIRQSSTGRYSDRLVEHLQKIDQDNRYTILLDPKDSWKPSAKNFSVQVCNIKKFSFNPFQQMALSRQLKSLKPDLVHFTMIAQQPLFYFGKYVVTTHDLTMLRFTRPGRLPLILHKLRMIGYRFLFWSGNRFASEIIVGSKFVAGDLASKQPSLKNKISLTYEASEPPIPGTATKPPVARDSQLTTYNFLLHVGSPFPHKNIERLIEAFEILVTDRPSLKLVLAGKREHYFEQLQKQIDASPARDNIIVTGFIPDSQLKWLYQNASAYVLPSLSEGFGLPGLEAMAHGCAVVSSDATCLPEVYGTAAHYFDPLDVQDMATKIKEVLVDKSLRAQLIASGHQQLKKYSWERMAQQTLEIYNKVLSKT